MDSKRKLIDLEMDTVIKLTTLALKQGSDLKNFAQKILKEVGDTGVYNSQMIKSLKVLVIDTDRCSCVSPERCELCNEDSAYNVFKKKIINLVSEIEERK